MLRCATKVAQHVGVTWGLTKHVLNASAAATDGVEREGAVRQSTGLAYAGLRATDGSSEELRLPGSRCAPDALAAGRQRSGND